MKKNIYILLFLIILPILLVPLYDKLFALSGNWTEDYKNYFEFGFLIISLVSSGWLLFMSLQLENTKSKYFWVIISLLLIFFIGLYIYIGSSLASIQIGG
jgi:Na+/H+ antiporter NhaD/arsenite permease-like protein